LVKKVLKYKYISTTIGWYLSTSTQVREKYLNTFISTVQLVTDDNKYNQSLDYDQ